MLTRGSSASTLRGLRHALGECRISLRFWRLRARGWRSCSSGGSDAARRWTISMNGQDANWTSDRPTKPGEYWLSIDPNKRKGRIDFPSVIPCNVSLCGNTYLMDHGSLDSGSDENGLTLAARYITGGAWIPVANDWYDGALWSVRETPADPFEEPQPAQKIDTCDCGPAEYIDGRCELDAYYCGCRHRTEEIIALLTPIAKRLPESQAEWDEKTSEKFWESYEFRKEEEVGT